MEPVLRPLMPQDAAAARAFVSARLAGTRYRQRATEMLDSALEFEDPEYMALLAVGDDERIVGLVLFGTVAGARSVVKVHAVIGGDRAAGLALLEAVRHTSEESGERMIVCELPDDPALAAAAAALDAGGYVEEGRVPDFITEGVALRLLVRPLLDT
jgi:hypothetical protein